MFSKEIRSSFFKFFESKSHKIVASAPMVVKDDPTLMFTNAGMNQFKDIFLGNSPIKNSRVANTQKCLRVSGKHNDLEEVGHDTYHHTMFEMLGNWSFNDYFKKEAIDYAWEYLTDVLKVDKNKLYATYFEGDDKDGLEADNEALNFWKKYLPEERIIPGSKKDNFWEMGESGPCGPCSEIHIDLRSENEKAKLSGRELVNQDHPRVMEIWNLVFIQFNRKADGKLETLAQRHVDTGMGFERLCMVLQNKESNYDTDVFMPIINELETFSGKKYGKNEPVDIAMRVIADHLRTVSFSIADGQLPGNAKAGYVIRRILRRAVRYYYTYLNITEPCIFKLVPSLIRTMGDFFPELTAQQELIEKVIKEEEHSFLKTLETGIKLLDEEIQKVKNSGENKISGTAAFILYDTYGFPLDLTQLMIKEHGLSVDVDGFNKEMAGQKNRSKQAAAKEEGDWETLKNVAEQEFTGYKNLSEKVEIIKYRQVKQKKGVTYHLAFNKTPFYAESGGQIGDTGWLINGSEKVEIIDTKKENNLNIHITNNLPKDVRATFDAIVDENRRKTIANNHTATHLLHYALREVLGKHVEQKGSLVAPDYLRFDFSHFEKISDKELDIIETKVNEQIRNNNERNEMITSLNEARSMGAMALFGEKYGSEVRVIKFNDSVELCGGTHVEQTGQIGFFKITSESSIAAGIRRIEAITASKAENYVKEKINVLEQLQQLIKAQKVEDVLSNIQNILNNNAELTKKIEQFSKMQLSAIKAELASGAEKLGNINIIARKVDVDSADLVKDLAFQLRNQFDSAAIILGATPQDKPHLTIMFTDNLVKEKSLNAGQIIREAAKEMQGGGGGQPFYATAGGKNPAGIEKAIEKAKTLISGTV